MTTVGKCRSVGTVTVSTAVTPTHGNVADTVTKLLLLLTLLTETVLRRWH